MPERKHNIEFESELNKVKPVDSSGRRLMSTMDGQHAGFDPAIWAVAAALGGAVVYLAFLN